MSIDFLRIVRKLVVLAVLVGGFWFMTTSDLTEPVLAAKCCQQCFATYDICSAQCADDYPNYGNRYVGCIQECESDENRCAVNCMNCSSGGGGGTPSLHQCCRYDGATGAERWCWLALLSCPPGTLPPA